MREHQLVLCRVLFGGYFVRPASSNALSRLTSVRKPVPFCERDRAVTEERLVQPAQVVLGTAEDQSRKGQILQITKRFSTRVANLKTCLGCGKRYLRHCKKRQIHVRGSGQTVLLQICLKKNCQSMLH